MRNKSNKNSPLLSDESSIFGLKADQKYMCAALSQARKAATRDEVPIGAVVVDAQGAIIGRGYNKVESSYSQTAHAELRAIGQATKEKKNWRLTDCWIYVTLEPCVMCIGLIMNSRMAGIVYGAQSLLFGYHLDKQIDSWVYKNNTFHIVKDVCAQQSVALLQDFFSKKREKQ